MDNKSLYDISWKVPEEIYREDSAYSYSTLSRFNREGFDNIDKLYEKIESPSLTFGSMVDTLLTDGREAFDSKFEVATFPTISDNLIQITKSLFDLYNEQYRSIDLISDNIISEIGEQYNYYASSKYASYRVKKIKEEGAEYYNLLFLSKNKVLINNNDYLDAIKCVDSLKNSISTKWYFEDNNPFNEDIQRFYQLKFKGEFEGIPLKCMADLLIVCNKDKTIIPCDLKTTGKKEWSFYKSFIDWGYFIQSQLYWYIIRQNLDKDPIFKDYKLLNYRFIVINRYNLKPLIWEYEDTKCIVDVEYNKYYCKNWRNIVKELDYYIKNKSEYPININNKDVNSITKWLIND